MHCRHTTLCSLLALAVSAPSLAQRTPDVRIDTTGSGTTRIFGQNTVLTDSSVVVVWDEGRMIRVNYSKDRGATWLGTALQIGSNASRCPSAAASGSSVYVAWQDCRWLGPGPEIYLNYSHDGGATWLSPAQELRLNTGPVATSTSTRPQVAVAGSSAYVVWEDARNFGSIRLNYTNDGGATWQANDIQLNTTTAGQGLRYPQIKAEGSSVYVVWEDWRNGQADIYLNRSADGGATWLGYEVRLDTDPPGAAPSRSPGLAVSSSLVYVFWDEGRNGASDIYFNHSSDGGATWASQDVRLNTNPVGTPGPNGYTIAVQGTSAYVAWTDIRSGRWQGDIYFNRSLDGGVTWLPNEVRLNIDPTGTTRSNSPSLAVRDSSVCLAWQDNRNNASTSVFDIYFRRSPDRGTTWPTSEVRLDTDPPGAAKSVSPRVVASESSTYVVWHDYRNGWEPDLYFNIPFGSMPYGSAHAGSGGLKPELDAVGSPEIGSSVALDIRRGLGGATGALALGAGQVSQTSTPLFGGTLLVQPAVTLPITLGGATGVPGAGFLSAPLAIPNLSALVGANLNFQALLLDAGATFGVSMTQGLEMWIG